MAPIHLLHVVGARPNFMKLAPVLAALERRGGVRSTVVHTGQHHDEGMSARSFDDLELRPPRRRAGRRPGHPRMPEELDRVLTDPLPDLLLTRSRDADGNLEIACGSPRVRPRRGSDAAGGPPSRG